MKHVWIVNNENLEHDLVFSNPKKAYDYMVENWKQKGKPPAYSTFLKQIKEYHYSNDFMAIYKQEVY